MKSTSNSCELTLACHALAHGAPESPEEEVREFRVREHGKPESAYKVWMLTSNAPPADELMAMSLRLTAQTNLN